MRITCRRHLSGLLLALVIASGCAPTFQDARLVGRGRFEITPNISGLGATSNGESEYAATSLAVQGQAGVHDRADVGIAYARMEADDAEGGLNAVGFGPKFGIVRDRIAVSLPVSFFFGDDVPTSETWQFHPTAIFTVPLSRHVDFSPSVRLAIGLCDDCNTLVGFGGGFGLRLRPRLTIRPEAGVLFDPGESGVLWSFGVGVSFRDR
jgi:hypothetical protein